MKSLHVVFAALALLAGSSAARAEGIKLNGRFPAEITAMQGFRTLGIDTMSGREGGKLAYELERRLAMGENGRPPYYVVLADGTAPDGIIRGNASSAVTETPYTRTDMVCPPGTGSSCTTKVAQVVYCMRRVVEFSGDISVVDNTSGRIVYSNRLPRRNEANWCSGQVAPWTVDQGIQWMIESVANDFRKAATPFDKDYTARFEDDTRGMDDPTKAGFKAALKQMKGAPANGCAQLRALLDANPDNATVLQGVGVCDEWARQYEQAAGRYQRALQLTGNRGEAKGALERVNRLIAGQATLNR